MSSINYPGCKLKLLSVDKTQKVKVSEVPMEASVDLTKKLLSNFFNAKTKKQRDMSQKSPAVRSSHRASRTMLSGS